MIFWHSSSISVQISINFYK